MDIKEIAEQVSKKIYVEDGLLLSKFISEKFAEALIFAYKAELMNEVGDTVAHLHKEFSWKNRQSECVVKITLKAQPEYGFTTPLYTSDQLATAILKATKPLDGELQAANTECEMFRKNGRISDANEIATLKAKLAAAQEDITEMRADHLKLTEENHTLRDRLATAEQRVSEACACTCENARVRVEIDSAMHAADAIRSGEWRKFVKEV